MRTGIFEKTTFLLNERDLNILWSDPFQSTLWGTEHIRSLRNYFQEVVVYTISVSLSLSPRSCSHLHVDVRLLLRITPGAISNHMPSRHITPCHATPRNIILCHLCNSMCCDYANLCYGITNCDLNHSHDLHRIRLRYTTLHYTR